MDNQKPTLKWISNIQMEQLVDNLVNRLVKENNIYDIDYETYDKIYGFIHFKSENKKLLINFKNSKRPILIKIDKLDNCCVCYDECDKTLKCGHYLCSSCVKWVQINNTCPVCRASNNYKIGHIFTIPFKIIKILILE